MAESGILWIDITFDSCVIFLYWVAAKLNITYEEINVYLFCIAWPLLTLYQTLRIRYLKGKMNG
jgi:hypothetical protein